LIGSDCGGWYARPAVGSHYCTWLLLILLKSILKGRGMLMKSKYWWLVASLYWIGNK
jgi:hypothetical protein